MLFLLADKEYGGEGGSRTGGTKLAHGSLKPVRSDAPTGDACAGQEKFLV